MAIVDLDVPTYITTHAIPTQAKATLKILPKPSTQVGCIPTVICKSKEVQTDEANKPKTVSMQNQTDPVPCKECLYEEHQIIRRQNYIIQDAIINTQKGYEAPYTSREDRCEMPIPGTTKHKNWLKKLTPQLKPRSPKEFTRYKQSPQFTRPELQISSQPQPTISKIRKPKALTIDNEVYTAICSRKRTQPVLVTSPKRLFLPPPPPNGGWTYTTTKY